MSTSSAFAGFWQSPKLPDVQMALIPPEKLTAIEMKYMENMFLVMNGGKPGVQEDNRFKANAWHEGWSDFVYRAYLVNSQHLTDLAEAVEAEPKVKNRIRFATEQVISSLSPSNYLATNPEAISELISSNGASLTNGIMNLLSDLREGRISQTNTHAFEIGKNVATTEGAIVFQNRLFQLIQFKPTTSTVYEKPFLMVPPCINKYYILDLQADTSMVKYLLDQGFTVYMISWKNPDQSMTHVTWDDYVSEGVIEAIKVVVEISKQAQINILGFCVGGTLVGSALGVLASMDLHPISSLTLLTSFLDFSDTGVLDVFIDEAMVERMENTIGGAKEEFGLFSGVELANTFSFLRPNDLVWNYVVGNYLLGKVPPAFDLLYWNGDSTNLPGPFYSWYLRHMYLQNELKIPNQLKICGQPVDLSKINCPTYIYASREDHIVPWQTAYLSNALIQSPKRFVLGASGHIAGVINPPHKNKRNYWVSNQSSAKKLPTASEWFDSATMVPGSWWPDFTKWLAGFSGKKVTAKKVLGNDRYPVIESAPGSYVREKAVRV